MPRFRPMSRLEELFAGEFVFETILASGVVAGGVTQGLRAISENPPNYGFAVSYFGVAIVLGVALMLRARSRNIKARETANPHALESVLYTLHEILIEYSKAEAKEGLRICVFVPGLKDGEAHQICSYVGMDEGRGRGRTMSCRCGVVGKAFRSGQALYARLPNNTNVVDYLVDQHGFERGEAAGMRQDAKAWAAIPVGPQGNVVAVIFLDSGTHDFFGKVGGNKRRILEYATIGVAKFIARN